jgi:hypothetical protein
MSMSKPLEFRRAWKHEIEALRGGKYGDAVAEKTKISTEAKSGRI